MKHLLIALSISSAWLCTSLYAQPLDASTQISVATGSLKYDAKERSTSGAVINHERGNLPFVQLGLRHAIAPDYFLDAEWRYADNTINYAGFTQIGIPITTQTKLAWQQAAVSAGYRHTFSPAYSLEATLGLGQRRIDRDIQPSLGSLPLREVLSTSQLQIGAKWQLNLNARTNVHVGVQLQQALGQSLKVDSYGLYDPITLSPAKQLDKRMYAGLSYTLSPVWRVQANLGRESIQPGASATEIWRKNGVPAAGVRYPGSKQKALDYSFQLSARF